VVYSDPVGPEPRSVVRVGLNDEDWDKTCMLLGGRYRLISTPVSNGSFGAVYAAEDEKMPRRVAVKILHAQHATNVTVRERFRRELAAVCRVQHENVVSVFDVGEDDRLGLYYVMELVQGTPLRDRISDTPPPWPFIYRFASQLSSALCAIHAADIVHRDLKPQNIMLVERPGFDELVKVLDFGIASIRENNEDALDAVLTGARNVLGTPPYMAPEQTYMRADRIRLGLDVDARSDLYALGIVLYELVTGRRPFGGDAHTIVLAHRNVLPMPLDRLAGVQAPRGFLRLVMQCLAKRPEDRPQTARAFLDVLVTTEHEKFDVAVPDAPLAPRDDDDAPTEMFMVPDEDPIGKWEAGHKRRRSLWWVGGLFVVGAVIALVFALKPNEEMPLEANGAVAASGITPTDSPDAGGTAPVEAALALDVSVAAPEAAEVAPVGLADASLVLTSVPAEVRVSINGEPRGVTPLTLQMPVIAGEIKTMVVKLELDDYEPATVTVEVGAEHAGRVVLVSETLTRVRRPTGPRGDGKPPGTGTSKDPFEDL